MVEREKCAYCGGFADPDTTCPKSIECPTCGAGQGESCRRPSGHRAATMHADRIREAEAEGTNIDPTDGIFEAREWAEGRLF